MLPLPPIPCCSLSLSCLLVIRGHLALLLPSSVGSVNMATFDRTINIQPTAPNPDFEPEEEWKFNLRQRVEDDLKPAAEKLKRELTEKLKVLGPPEDSRAQNDYDIVMARLRRSANNWYHELLERERQERRSAAGDKVNGKWSEISTKGQQATLYMYRKGATGKNKQPEAIIDEEHSQPPSPANFEPPPRPTWEIWIPPSSESTASPTPIYATMGTKKSRRDGSTSIGTPWIPSKPGPSSMNSLRRRPPIIHQPFKRYPDDESTSDSEDDFEPLLPIPFEVESIWQETNAKQKEAGVTRWREEARKEAGLRVEEAETKRGEELPKRKEGEAKEEARQEDLLRALGNEPRHPSRSYRDPSPNILARSASSTTKRKITPGEVTFTTSTGPERGVPSHPRTYVFNFPLHSLLWSLHSVHRTVSPR